ncbi:MAG: IS66 family insertion sequence element accessory protein TnpB [Acetobacterium woodii]|nr:IS66 family insertion sequence element accessory protein TnpB [Acetobacterium woodii]
MRRQIDGLAAIVQMNFQLDPFQNSLFLFCGKKRDRMKALFWEGDGFLLLYKRLETGMFQWPKSSEEVREITPQQYRWLLEGLSIDQKKVIVNVSNKRLF